MDILYIVLVGWGSAPVAILPTDACMVIMQGIWDINNAVDAGCVPVFQEEF